MTESSTPGFGRTGAGDPRASHGADASADAAVHSDVVGRFARALRERVQAQRHAAERLASFAFSETSTGRRREPSPIESADWQYFVGRTLRAVCDPAGLVVLRALEERDRRIDEICGLVGSIARDPLAVDDLVSGLMSAGLVIRPLETDTVSLTPLGAAAIDLVVEIGHKTAADAR